MTISNFLAQANKSQTISEIIAQAKEKNQSNPAVLTWDDEYVQSRQDTLLSKPLQ